MVPPLVFILASQSLTLLSSCSHDDVVIILTFHVQPTNSGLVRFPAKQTQILLCNGIQASAILHRAQQQLVITHCNDAWPVRPAYACRKGTPPASCPLHEGESKSSDPAGVSVSDPGCLPDSFPLAHFSPANSLWLVRDSLSISLIRLVRQKRQPNRHGRKTNPKNPKLP